MRAGYERDREDFLADVVDVAWEELGQPDAWGEVLGYRWTTSRGSLSAAGSVALPDVHPGRHGGSSGLLRLAVGDFSYDVTPKTVADAYKRLRIEPGLMYWQTRRRVKRARAENDAELLHSGDPGDLVQIGLWGEVRFA